MSTNWKQGMLRVWVIASLLWVAGMGWYQYQGAEQRKESGLTIALDDKELRIDSTGIREENTSTLQMQRIGWIALPPLALLMLIPLGGWLGRGFKPETK